MAAVAQTQAVGARQPATGARPSLAKAERRLSLTGFPPILDDPDPCAAIFAPDNGTLQLIEGDGLIVLLASHGPLDRGRPALPARVRPRCPSDRWAGGWLAPPFLEQENTAAPSPAPKVTSAG